MQVGPSEMLGGIFTFLVLCVLVVVMIGVLYRLWMKFKHSGADERCPFCSI